MASSISAGTTAGTAIVVSGDTSGSLVLQTNGTTTAVTIDTSQNVGIGTSSPTGLLHLAKASGAADIRLSVGGTLYGNIYASASDTSIFSIAANPLILGTNNTERMRIDSSGNVGIGTTTPDALLTVNTIASFGDGAAGTPSIAHKGDLNTGVWFPAADTIAASTGGTERMRIDSSGNLLVGTTSASGRFTSTSASTTSTPINANSPASFTTANYASNSATAAGTGWYHFYGVSSNNTVQNIIIYGNGNIQNANNSYGALSDIKLKENILDATPKLAQLNQVRVVNFNLKNDPNHKQLGVIAQELEQIFPSMIEETSDCEQQTKTREVEIPAVEEVKDAEGNITTKPSPATTYTEEYTELVVLGTTTKSVKYSVFVPMLIKSIQEQQALILALTTRISALEAK